ncbi:ABC transporter ATP-binding protein [Chengkuizengella marina]|uniref:ATP-binding cassette domain-containing protein n=1 Tax=Chengkuizengella marina TaxID=2507566 RepID=A0A6N9Q5G0_9BACL|nr:ATP-binding cassette domain-containing protein [Chengkuizengella marina]NBI30057.1 ATP-binding cassette domain-containing protein [Chengkuizengella marina]
MTTLKLDQVTKQFVDKTAVDHIDLSVSKGEIYGLLGANGAGKTTTMRMVLGLIYPDEGQILYNGKAFTEELTSKLGYLPEERGLYPKVKVSDQLLYLAQLRGYSKKQADKNLKDWLERFDVSEYYNKKVEELSKGNQQKIQFIASVIHDPEILILDEAFSGLDPVNVELLKGAVKDLRDGGTCILFSTHRMEHVEELCSNISILDRSKTVLKGNIKKIKSTFPRERVILGVENEISGFQSITGVKSVHKKSYGYEINISEVEAAQDILKLAMDQSTVSRFEVLEPTLNEIFIKVVGGEGSE